MRRCTAIALLTGIVALGIALRLHQLTARTLWFDEAYTWHLSRFPVPELLDRVAQDNSPPLYFLMLHVWMRLFGESVFAMRCMSVLLGVCSIFGTYFFCAELFRDRSSTGSGAAPGRAVGLLAALLMAVNSFQIIFAWEARMYALGAALAAWSSWALLVALHRPRSAWGWWSAYALMAAALPYSHYYGLFTLTAHGLYVLVLLVQLRRDTGRARDLAKGAVFAALAIAACYAPWLPAFLEQRAHVKAQYWTGPLDPWTIPNTFARIVFPTDRPVLQYGRSALALELFLVAALVLLRKCRPQATFLLLGAVVPFAAATAISLFDVAVFSYRYFLFAAVFVLTTVAAAIAQLPQRSWRWIAAGSVAGGMVLAHLALLEQWNMEGRRGIRDAVAWIADHANNDDTVIVGSPLLLFTTQYYLQDGPPCRLLETTPTRHYEGGPGLLPEMVCSPAQVADATSRRLWVLDTDGVWWRNREVPAPIHGPWKLATRQIFPELYGFQGNVILREFRRDGSTSTALNPATDRAPTARERPGSVSDPVS